MSPHEFDSSLLALIKLLADDHAEVVEAARAKLVQLGSRALLLLTQTAEHHEDAKVRVEARAVLERIRLVNVGLEWEKTANLPNQRINLEEGAWLMARVRYPDFDPKGYREQLDQLAERVRPQLKRVSGSKQRLQVINRFLFKDEGFRGNWNDYFDPQNSYLNRVLDRKLGIPISLSLVYLLVAKRLKLPVEGVGIPGHFMIKYQDAHSELYVDPFNEGRFLSRPECVQFIVESGYPYQREFLDGVTPREMLARILRNLILIYVDRHERTLESTLTRFLDLLYPNTEFQETEPEDLE